MLLIFTAPAFATLTPGNIPVTLTGGSTPTIQDSLISQSGSIVSIAGTLNATTITTVGSSGSAKISSASGIDVDAANAVFTIATFQFNVDGSATVGGSGYSSFPGGVDVTNGSELRTSGNRVNYSLITYATGTVYSLTNTDAAVTFGTTSPSITIDKTGTYLIYAVGQLKYNAATFAGTQTATIHLHRTNETPADITSATTTLQLKIITAITDNAGTFYTAPVLYTTSNTDDAIAVYGSLSASTGAGTVDVTQATIIATRLY